jgi:hypothetical protein
MIAPRPAFHALLLASALGSTSALATEPAGALPPSDVLPEPRSDAARPSDAADPTATAPHPPPPALAEPRAPSPLPEIAAVFPGFILHGSGVWLQHRNQTAQRLLLLEGASVLATLTSGVVLFTTGAARDVVGPTALLAVAGVGTFSVSFLANLYAAWAPAEGLGEALQRLPLLESSAGYLYVYDPQFEYRHFLTAQLSGRVDAWHLSAGTAVAPGQGNGRLELAAGYRLLGPRGAGAEAVRGGSYLEPRLGFSHHEFERDGFSARVIELALEARLDVDEYLPDVRGAFFQAEAGWAKQVFHHDLPGPDPATWTSLLLAHVGFGMYLGNRNDDRKGGEVQVYYDHRHDGFAGGLKVNGLGSGVAGHFGVLANYQLSPAWGVRVRTEAGSAYTLALDLVVRTW